MRLLPADEPFTGLHPELYTLAVLLVPGQRPHVFAGQRHVQNTVTTTDLERENAFKRLVAAGVGADLGRAVLTHLLGPEETWPSAVAERRRLEAARDRLYGRDELWDMAKPFRGENTDHGGFNTNHPQIMASLLRLTPPAARFAELAKLPAGERRDEVLRLLTVNGVATRWADVDSPWTRLELVETLKDWVVKHGYEEPTHVLVPRVVEEYWRLNWSPNDWGGYELAATVARGERPPRLLGCAVVYDADKFAFETR